jgi:predicted DNA-binding transcriptional regulator AlpA
MEIKTYTTAEAAEKIGVSRSALYLWIGAGLVDAPKPIKLGRRSMRLWTRADIERVKKFKGSLPRGPRPTENGVHDEC